MNDSGKCAFVLGIELVDNDNESMTMCQRRYVEDVEKTAAVKKTPRQAASSVEASGRPSFAIPVGTGMYQ
uniref:Uncharacterized protein n=1 Tax=Peronospora matthiolae TaxID=2874970 RepID=A0AAV1T7T8_9STRA